MRDKIHNFSIGFFLGDLLLLLLTLFPFQDEGVVIAVVLMVFITLIYVFTLPRYHGKFVHPEL